EVDANGKELSRKDSFRESGIFNNGHTFITKNETVKLRIWIGNNNLGAGEYYFEFPKLEVGNKPTDWTPAPEDIDEKFTDIEGTLASHSTKIEQNAQQIQLRATKAEVDTLS